MTSTFKPLWAALALAALVTGCASEEAANPETPATTPSTSYPVGAPPVTPGPAPETAPAKGGMPTDATVSPVIPPTPGADRKETPTPKADMPKDDAPKVDTPKVDAPKIDAPKADAGKDAPKADAGKDAPKAAAAGKLDDAEIAEIKKLPADEQDAALAQMICPVSAEHLGSMGTPIKVSAEGKTFYICCKSCKKEVDSDPKSVIAKLAK